MLKGKAKIEFEKWYNPYMCREHGYDITMDEADYEFFWGMAKSMQYGVLVDWFDSVGFDIDNVLLSLPDMPRPQARAKAIERANEIYNNR
jgi:hypothetical protein